MQFRAIAHVLGILMQLYSISLLPPFLIALYHRNEDYIAFSTAFILINAAGFLAWWPNRGRKEDIGPREGFLIVFLFWIVFGFIGALPLMLASHHELGIVDSLFESFSGLTGTGSSVVTDIDALPPAINYYRHQLCWLGGMGIIVLAVAVMPMLGIGGMQLYRAESPGPTKDKLTPRITETAKALWIIYVGLTIACTLAFHFAGMGWLDAVCHAFSTIATAGFSTHNASLGYFNSALIDYIAIFFMFISAFNFSLHFAALRHGKLSAYWQDPELRFFAQFAFAAGAFISLSLWLTGVYPSLADAVRFGLFHVVSLISTTGYVTAPFTEWPQYFSIGLIALCFIGGCAGSTASGIKPIRALVIIKHAWREVYRLMHPNGVFAVKIGNQPVQPSVLDAVWGYLALYAISFWCLMALVMLSGLDFVSAFGAVACSLNNAGAGLGVVSSNYAGIPDATKMVLVLGMILGRLEIFTFLVLLTPAFWRR